MDAGVPILAPVAGISCGMISKTGEDGKISDYTLLTDILEQKTTSAIWISRSQALRKASQASNWTSRSKASLRHCEESDQASHEARYKILDVMTSEIEEPRTELNLYSSTY